MWQITACLCLYVNSRDTQLLVFFLSLCPWFYKETAKCKLLRPEHWKTAIKNLSLSRLSSTLNKCLLTKKKVTASYTIRFLTPYSFTNYRMIYGCFQSPHAETDIYIMSCKRSKAFAHDSDVRSLGQDPVHWFVLSGPVASATALLIDYMQ